MKIDKGSLVLYSIHILMERDVGVSSYTRNQLADALNIERSTLDLYISRLKSHGFLTTRSRKYGNELLSNMNITDDGEQEVEAIKKSMDSLLFTTERHGINRVIKMNDVLDRLTHPLDRIMLLSLYCKRKRFDLPRLVGTLSISHQDIYLVNILTKITREDGGDPGDFMDVFYKILYCRDVTEQDIERFAEKENGIDTILILAEAYRRHGRLEEAENTYSHLLSSGRKLTQHHWFIITINLALINLKRGKTESTFEILEKIKGQTKESLYLSYVNEVLAYTYSQLEDYSRSLRLFRSCINSFIHLGYPIFLWMSYNDRGVLLFKMGKTSAAEKDWRRAKQYAKEAGSLMAEAIVITNIADILMKKGKIKGADTQLDRAEKMFREIGDYERIAAIEFNRALLSLERDDMKGAVVHFNLSEEVAQPLPSPLERRERRGEFVKRAKDRGFYRIESFINPA